MSIYYYNLLFLLIVYKDTQENKTQLKTQVNIFITILTKIHAGFIDQSMKINHGH